MRRPVKMMRRSLHLALILCLALTGIGLGVARGTVAVGGQVVLCTGAGVVVVDHPDAQGGFPHICPDMALSLLAAVASEPHFPAHHVTAAALSVFPPTSVLLSFGRLPASARDPPSAVAT